MSVYIREIGNLLFRVCWLESTARRARSNDKQAKLPGQPVLVVVFIEEIEGHPADVSNRGQFTDLSRNTSEMLKRLDERFGKWLKGEE